MREEKKIEMLTGGQAHELTGWANRLTSDEYQERRGFLTLLTDPNFPLDSIELKDLFVLTDSKVVIRIPALPRPTLTELQENWSSIKSIERDDSTTKAVTIRLATVLRPDEERISGSDYEKRLSRRRSEGGLLGFQHRKWFLENQDKLPESVKSALTALLGKIYIDFPGIVVVFGAGSRCVPYVGRGSGRWSDYWFYLARDFSRCGRVAVVSK